MAKTLKQLCEGIIDIQNDARLEGITTNSKEAKENWLFLAEKEDYIQEALDHHAYVLSPFIYPHPHHYQVEELPIDELFQRYYDNLCDAFFVIGITGTNGKSSVAHYLRQLFEFKKRKVCVIGTDGILISNQCYPTHNTTPSLMENFHTFQRCKRLGIQVIIMEISSHAIDQRRIDFIHFDRILYTNIQQDHLDYHHCLTHYQYTKFKLRNYLKKDGYIIMNNDTSQLSELLTLTTHHIITVGRKNAHYHIGNIQLACDGSSFEFANTAYQTSCLAEFNVENIALMLAVGKSLRYSDEELQRVVSHLHPLNGRLEVIKQQPCIWIDFAHTPMAIKKVLLFAKRVAQGRVISILGCGGNRDQDKRAKMGTIASLYSDIAIFTEDNSRNEKTLDILKAMSVNVQKNVLWIENRQLAIQKALSLAKENDIILIMGKGNEQFLIANYGKIPYNDKAFILSLFEEETKHEK